MAGRYLSRGPLLLPSGQLAPEQERYLRSLLDVPQWLGEVTLEDQAASISGRPIVVVGRLQSGIYRVSYYARITQAAGTSSSLTVQFRWTDGGVPQTQTAAALTGNTTATIQQDRLMVRVDRDTSIVVDATYASVGSPSMQFRLNLALERLV